MIRVRVGLNVRVRDHVRGRVNVRVRVHVRVRVNVRVRVRHICNHSLLWSGNDYMEDEEQGSLRVSKWCHACSHLHHVAILPEVFAFRFGLRSV